MKFKDYSLPETELSIQLDTSLSNQPDAPEPITDAALQKEAVADKLENVTLTHNFAVTHRSSLSACLDFFFQIQTGSDVEKTLKYLKAAWDEDPNVTLRLIFQLRDIRNGKGALEPFLFCLNWLRENHFETLLCNLEHVATLGRWKDLLDLLIVRIQGAEAYEEYLQNEKNMAVNVRGWKDKKREPRSRGHLKARVFHPSRTISKDEAAAVARLCFLDDKDYHKLHIRVASLFAAQLKKDLVSMEAGKSVSLAGKWAPSACKRHDRHTLIVSTISQLLFPQKEFQKENYTYGEYVSAARNMYRKVYLSPLRKHANITERLMSDRRWSDIPYSQVPSVCMNRNKTVFSTRDGERFAAYLDDVKKGKTAIKSSALQPHQLVDQVIDGKAKDLEPNELSTIQLQWEAYVTKLRESGSLSNCMAVCDVSGSMFGLPIKVAIALSLLVADLAEDPYKGLLCTFSSKPELFQVPDGVLDAKVDAVKGMNWGQSTNVEKVFDLILGKALEYDISKERMVNKLFIFSDMQFNAASDSGKTNFEVVKSKFNESGYDLPQLVFWNLSDQQGTGGHAVPVLKYEENTAMISGFSGQLLKLFMEGNEEGITPISILMKAIQSYDFLSVVD